MKEIEAVQKIRTVLRHHARHKDNNKNVLIIGTGGTFDKIHDPISESLVFSENSHMQQILEAANVFGVRHQLLMMKDSLELMDGDRELMVQAIRTAPEKHIVITHGTSTMAQTAVYLKNSNIHDKTVILTGALRPYSLMQSDAEFNLGCAITAAQLIQTGVYITMNGQIFPAGSVEKNLGTGTFTAK